MIIRPSYRQYERKKLGFPSSTLEGLVFMLRRSFLAPTFAAFWQNWNPLFSYYLLFRVYRPFKQWLPRSLALILTFTVSGLVHDIAAMLFTWRVFYLFSLTFTLYGLYVVGEMRLGFHLQKAPLWARPFYHLGLLSGMYVMAEMLVRFRC